LLRYGTAFYKSKNKTDRIIEIRDNINELLDEINPNIVVTQMLDLRHTLKRDLENIMNIRTILRLLCADKNIMYNEFCDIGWTKRLTNTKRPSKKAKLKIVREYSEKIDREEIADAIILGESVIHNRLQIGEM
jgi:Holliday junction resolvasome RuvABC endonuclease subunit